MSLITATSTETSVSKFGQNLIKRKSLVQEIISFIRSLSHSGDYGSGVENPSITSSEYCNRSQPFADYVNENLEELLRCDPFEFSSRNPNDRQNLASSNIDILRSFNLKITQGQYEGIISMSDLYCLNELVCLEVWMEASKPAIRRWLENELMKPVNSLEQQMHLCASALFEYDKYYLLNVVYLLFVTVHLHEYDNSKRQNTIISTTSFKALKSICLKLIDRGIISVLLKSLLKGFDPSFMLPAVNFRMKLLELVSQTLFLAIYHTQVTIEESHDVEKLIRDISALINKEEMNLPEKLEERVVIFSILQNLQITQIAMLQQTSMLYNRGHNAPEQYVKANCLRQDALSRSGLDIPWTLGSSGVKGLLALSYSILRQPMVDENKAPKEDVEWFLRQACELRAYSHLRLCIIQHLQAKADEDGFQTLQVATISELIQNLIMIFSMGIYRMQPENGFPFFLPETQLDVGGHFDSFEDFLMLIHDFCLLRPSFGHIFWNSASMDSSHHPFVQLVAKGSVHNQYLLPYTWRFFAVISCGYSDQDIKASSTLATFNFIRYNTRHPELNWNFFFNVISNIVDKCNMEKQHDASIRSIQFSPEDLDSLDAILELLCAVFQSPHAANQIIIDGYQPLHKLFSLLVCPLPIELRGRIFVCLAAFARASNEIVQEIWILMEHHGILPLQGNSFGRYGSWLGVREDLEDLESKEKKYPVTNGFLTLLEALLHAHDSSEEDDREEGLRGMINVTMPATMPVYIGYIIDDVLFKVHSRAYSPEGQAGKGQMFKIATRCIRILSLTLQKYNLLETTHSKIDNPITAEFQSTYLEDFSDTFIEKSVEANENGSFKDNKYFHRLPRPKSSGFVIMALILSRSRLLEMIFRFLSECGGDNPEISKQIRYQEVCKDALTIFRVTRFQKNFAFPVGYPGSSKAPDLDAESDLSMYSTALTSCDCSYWMERLSTACVGLLYECMLRSRRFIELFLQTGSKCSLVFIQNSRLVSIPIILHHYHDILCDPNVLTLLVSFIRTNSIWSGHSHPSLPVMAARILEHIAKFSSSSIITSTLATSQDQLHALILGCSQGILFEDVNIRIMEDVPLGGITPHEHHSIIESSSNEMSIRDSLLSLLLSSLPRNSFGLCHQILGFQMNSLSSSFFTNFKRLDLEEPISGLEAVLSLLKPGQTISLIQSHPHQAIKCFELIYKLCVSPITSHITLDALRQPQINFFLEQFLELRYLMELSDDDLCFGKLENLTAIHNSLLSCAGFVSGACAIEFRYLTTCRPDGKSLLKPLLQSLFFEAVAETNAITEMDMSTADIEKTLIPLMNLFLRFIMRALKSQVLVSNVIHQIKSEKLKSILQYCHRPITTGNTSHTSWNVFNDVDVQRIAEMNLAVINVETFASIAAAMCFNSEAESDGLRKETSTLIIDEDEIQEAIQSVKATNNLRRIQVSSFILSRAWRQLVDVVFLQCKDSILGDTPSFDGDASTIHHLVEYLLLPSLDVLGTCAQDLSFGVYDQLVTEQLALSMLSFTKFLCDYVTVGLRNHVLSSTDYHATLSNTIRAIKSCSRASTSECRGYCHVALSNILQIPLKIEEQRKKRENPLSNTAKEVLTSSIIEIVELLGRDVIDSVLEWKITSMAALSNVLSVLVINDASNGFSAACQVLTSRNILQQIVRAIDLDATKEVEYLTSSLALCNHIAVSMEGVDSLIKAGLLSKLADMKILESMQIDQFDVESDNYSVINAILQLLCTLGATCPNGDVLTCLAKFMRKNEVFLLSMIHSNINCIAKMELLDLILSLSQLMLQGGDSMNGQVWSNLIGEALGDAITSSVCGLLKQFGSPQLLSLWSLQGAISHRKFWLSEIIDPNQLSVSTKEAIELLYMKILSHIAIFLRLRSLNDDKKSSMNEVRVQRRVIGVDISLVIESFSSCANVLLKIDSNNPHCGMLLSISENLWCALYELITQIDVSGMITFSVPMEQAIQIAEKFPVNSFIRQVGRRLRDNNFQKLE